MKSEKTTNPLIQAMEEAIEREQQKLAEMKQAVEQRKSVSRDDQQTSRGRDRRRRGAGSIYKRPGCDTYSIKFYRGGRPIRESTGLTDYQAARQHLNRRLGQVSSGTFAGLEMERTRMAELAADLFRDYRLNERKTLRHAEIRWRKHLEPNFGLLRACDVNSALVDRYVDQRIQEGAKAGTINRETALLRRMFHLGYNQVPPKVLRLPRFPRVTERNVRKGFVESGQYEGLAQACAEEGLWLRAMFEVAFNFGWRVSELLNLKVQQVDLRGRTIRLEVGDTKNGEGRTVVMTAIVQALVAQAIAGKQPCDYVFTRENGRRVLDFRRAWTKVCAKAKQPGTLFHDLRRTAVRNMVRAGISEKIAMTISGHRTRAVFDRYDIVSLRDISDAAKKLESTTNVTHDFGHNLGHNWQENALPEKDGRLN